MKLETVAGPMLMLAGLGLLCCLGVVRPAQKRFRCVGCGIVLLDSERYGYFSYEAGIWLDNGWCKGDMLKRYDREYHP